MKRKTIEKRRKKAKKQFFKEGVSKYAAKQESRRVTRENNEKDS